MLKPRLLHSLNDLLKYNAKINLYMSIWQKNDWDSHKLCEILQGPLRRVSYKWMSFKHLSEKAKLFYSVPLLCHKLICPIILQVNRLFLSFNSNHFSKAFIPSFLYRKYVHCKRYVSSNVIICTFT